MGGGIEEKYAPVRVLSRLNLLTIPSCLMSMECAHCTRKNHIFSFQILNSCHHEYQ